MVGYVGVCLYGVVIVEDVDKFVIDDVVCICIVGVDVEMWFVFSVVQVVDVDEGGVEEVMCWW